MIPAIVPIYAAIFAVMLVALSLRVAKTRGDVKVAIGDGGNIVLRRAIRVQGNFTEYVPMALILMALIETFGGKGQLLWLFGIALVIGRLLHPFGMERPSPNPFRITGILLTYLVTVGLIVWAVILLV